MQFDWKFYYEFNKAYHTFIAIIFDIPIYSALLTGFCTLGNRELFLISKRRIKPKDERISLIAGALPRDSSSDSAVLRRTA